MLVDKDMKVIHVSTFVSQKKACDLVKTKRILTVIHLSNKIVKDLVINKPRIGVAGLNPQAGVPGLSKIKR